MQLSNLAAILTLSCSFLATTTHAWTVSTYTSTNCGAGGFTHTGSGDSGCINTDGGVQSFEFADIDAQNCAYFITYEKDGCPENYVGLEYDPSDEKFCYANKYTLASWEVGGCTS